MNGGKMSETEELEVFVSERLHAAVAEIIGVFKKTLKGYEQQAARLKEENQRNRSLLEIILKANIQGRPIKSLPVSAGPAETDSSTVSKVTKTRRSNIGRPTKSILNAASPRASDSSNVSNIKKTWHSSRNLWSVFSSRDDLLKHASGGNCSYCLKSAPATKTHLIKRHYLNAVHFTDNGTGKFVIACTCKDFVQRRSHWHCPCCTRVISRRTNFQRHISKQHGYSILQPSQDADLPNVSTFEVVPLTPGSCCEQDQHASVPLQVREVSHPKCQDSVQIKVKQMQKSNSILSFVADHASLIVNSDSFTQELSKSLNTVKSGKAQPLPNSSNQHLEMQPDSGDGGILQPAGESQPNKLCSTVKSSNTKRKMRVKRFLPPLRTQLSVSENPKVPHTCKACGKTFHYLYTLKAHTQRHAVDKTKICGLCGKHFESKESFVKHLHSHTNRNNKSRLKRYGRIHRPKGLNVKSPA